MTARLYIHGSLVTEHHLDMLLIHCLLSGHRLLFCTYLWMWHYGSSCLPRCVCLCNLPRNSQHSLQLCAVVGSRHCAALWCVQHVPYLRLSKYCMKSHQSVAPQPWIIAERGRVVQMRSRKGLGKFYLQEKWWKYVKGLGRFIFLSVIHLLLLYVEFLQRPKHLF